MKEPNTSNALPNNYGRVRTFKGDFENFEKKGFVGESPEAGEKPLGEVSPHQAEAPQTIPAPSGRENIPDNPFQSVPTPPPLPTPESGLPAFKSSPSQSFFAEKMSPAESVPPERSEEQPLPLKSGRRYILPVIIVLIIAAVAGSGFYYWFYMRNVSVSSAPAATPTVPQATPTASSETSQNKNLRQLVVDTSQSPTEIKNAVQKFASEFATSASENDLVEVKMFSKDNQPIGKKDFFAGFGTTVPDAVLMKLSEDYSLFARKEGSTAKLGLVFKTVTSSGLADEMKNWESKMPTDLNSLYPVPSTAPAPATFNSGQYKNADIRYFNFSSPANTSLDYSVISNFLVIGTSKDTTRAVLDYMAAK